MATRTIRLGEIAYARSGDKGASANLGILAYTPEGYAYLADKLTADAIKQFFAPMGCEEVTRYDLPNLSALNFILRNILAGGGSRSLRIDAQGKAIGQIALEMSIEIDDDVLEKCRRR